MLIGARNESFVGFERAMLYMVDVVVLMKLYFEPSHVRLTQPQPLPHSIFDLDQALIRIIETAYSVKTARRQSLDAHRIYWRGYRLGSDAKASACGRACATYLPANANTSPELPPNTQVLQLPTMSRTSPQHTTWMAYDALHASHDARPQQA